METPRPPRSVAPRSVAIVGAGFSGTMLAAHLLRGAREPLRIVLVERADRPGSGLAYSTPCDAHLLNVRAYNMSAYPDDPRHFLRWLWARDDGAGVPPSGHAFVSRALYGAYIRDVLTEARAKAGPDTVLELVRDEATEVEATPGSVRLRLASGAVREADTAYLCIGHFPPSPPPLPATEVFGSARWIGDPWDMAALATVPPDGTVLVLGTGLTMVDIVLSLLDRGHRGRIVAVSRRGLLPHRHEEVRPYTSFVHPEVLPLTVLDVLIALKADVRRARQEGYDWRSAFDAMRPHHHRLWANLPLEERRRFLRHARPFWEVHRHRMAPEVARRIGEAIGRGQLEVRAGRLQALTPEPAGVAVRVRGRGGAAEWSLTVDAVVNATGTECDFARIRHPLVRAMLDRGLARPDALRLGLDVTPGGALIDREGAASDRLFALGPVSKAPFWEMTAVPELRSQCAAAAARLLDGLHAAAAAAA